MKIKNAKDFAKYSTALRAFINCRYFLSLLSNEKNDENISALWGAICVNYRRPFGKNSDFGAISEKLVPAEYKSLHESLKEQRDKFFAHSDGSALIGNIRVHEVRFIVNKGKIAIEDRFVLPNHGATVRLNELILHLINCISPAGIDYLNTNFKDFRLDEGKYVLNWETDSLKKIVS